MLQRNIFIVTTYIRKKLEQANETDLDRKVITLVPAKDDKLYYFDGNSYWRVMIFIANAITRETVDAANSYTAGIAFGNFQSMLADIPDKLGETIPDFHNMEFRLRQLHAMMKVACHLPKFLLIFRVRVVQKLWLKLQRMKKHLQRL